MPVTVSGARRSGHTTPYDAYGLGTVMGMSKLPLFRATDHHTNLHIDRAKALSNTAPCASQSISSLTRSFDRSLLRRSDARRLLFLRLGGRMPERGSPPRLSTHGRGEDGDDGRVAGFRAIERDGHELAALLQHQNHKQQQKAYAYGKHH